jgi:hypothetical protein
LSQNVQGAVAFMHFWPFATGSQRGLGSILVSWQFAGGRAAVWLRLRFVCATGQENRGFWMQPVAEATQFYFVVFSKNSSANERAIPEAAGFV